MDKAEFDKFADEYRSLHEANIRISQESPDFFAEYKVKDTALLALNKLQTGELDILDFGTGVGNSVPFFRRHLPDANLYCLDVSADCLALAQERFSGQAEFVQFDGDVIPFPEAHFDLAFAACVFHHIPTEEHKRHLSDLLRVLRPGGMLVIFEHNPFNLLTVRAVNTCAFDENAVLIKAQTMMQRASTVGFENVERKYRIFFPGSLRALRPLEPFLSWLPLGAQYYIAARKSPKG